MHARQDRPPGLDPQADPWPEADPEGGRHEPGTPGPGSPHLGRPELDGPPAAAEHGRVRPVLRALLVGVAVAVALVVTGVGALALVHRGEALPGTVAAGVEVGGLGPADIRDRLAPVAVERSERPVQVTVAGGVREPVTPVGAGYAVDLEASVTRALEAGREGGPVAAAWAHVESFWASREVALADSVDRGAARRSVDAIADAADRAPDPGGITVDPASLQVAQRLPVTGVTVSRQEAVDALAAALSGPRGDAVALPAQTVDPGTTADDVAAVATQAEAALAGPVVLTAADLALTLEPASYAGLLGSAPDEQSGLRLTVDTQRLAEVVSAAAAAQVDQAARSARLAAPARGPVFDDPDAAVWSPVPAQVSVVEPSVQGRAVDVATATAAAESAIRTGSRAGPLAVTVTEPAVPTDAAARVTAVIGTFTTYHPAGQPRVLNIHRIADEIDGTVVPPGEQFSIDGITGRRTAAEGYVAAPQIVRGELEDGIAGGISQFATTMVNAAFFAGLPLDEFRPHSYYISRYPKGREATLAYGALDVKWTNDTGAPVLVDTSYTGTSITVTLYGDNGGRRVEASAPRERPRAGGGSTVTVTRTVTGPVSSQRTITTRYNPPPEG